MSYVYGVVVAAVVGAAVWQILPASPNEPPGALQVLAIGSFQPGPHERRGEGTAALIQRPDGTRTLTISGLDVASGPDLVLLLVTAEDVETAGVITSAGWLNLGPLQSHEGDQVYPIPEDADLADYRSVVIWSQGFESLRAVAELNL